MGATRNSRYDIYISPQEMRTLDDPRTLILLACASCQCANAMRS